MNQPPPWAQQQAATQQGQLVAGAQYAHNVQGAPVAYLAAPWHAAGTPSTAAAQAPAAHAMHQQPVAYAQQAAGTAVQPAYTPANMRRWTGTVTQQLPPDYGIVDGDGFFVSAAVVGTAPQVGSRVRCEGVPNDQGGQYVWRVVRVELDTPTAATATASSMPAPGYPTQQPAVHPAVNPYGQAPAQMAASAAHPNQQQQQQAQPYHAQTQPLPAAAGSSSTYGYAQANMAAAAAYPAQQQALAYPAQLQQVQAQAQAQAQAYAAQHQQQAQAYATQQQQQVRAQAQQQPTYPSQAQSHAQPQSQPHAQPHAHAAYGQTAAYGQIPQAAYAQMQPQPAYGKLPLTACPQPHSAYGHAQPAAYPGGYAPRPTAMQAASPYGVPAAAAPATYAAAAAAAAAQAAAAGGFSAAGTIMTPHARPAAAAHSAVGRPAAPAAPAGLAAAAAAARSGAAMPAAWVARAASAAAATAAANATVAGGPASSALAMAAGRGDYHPAVAASRPVGPPSTRHRQSSPSPPPRSRSRSRSRSRERYKVDLPKDPTYERCYSMAHVAKRYRHMYLPLDFCRAEASWLQTLPDHSPLQLHGTAVVKIRSALKAREGTAADASASPQKKESAAAAPAAADASETAEASAAVDASVGVESKGDGPLQMEVCQEPAIASDAPAEAVSSKDDAVMDGQSVGLSAIDPASKENGQDGDAIHKASVPLLASPAAAAIPAHLKGVLSRYEVRVLMYHGLPPGSQDNPDRHVYRHPIKDLEFLVLQRGGSSSKQYRAVGGPCLPEDVREASLHAGVIVDAGTSPTDADMAAGGVSSLVAATSTAAGAAPSLVDAILEAAARRTFKQTTGLDISAVQLLRVADLVFLRPPPSSKGADTKETPRSKDDPTLEDGQEKAAAHGTHCTAAEPGPTGTVGMAKDAVRSPREEHVALFAFNGDGLAAADLHAEQQVADAKARVLAEVHAESEAAVVEQAAAKAQEAVASLSKLPAAHPDIALEPANMTVVQLQEHLAKRGLEIKWQPLQGKKPLVDKLSEWINSKRADMLANGNPTLAALEQAKKAAVKAAEIAAAARGAANTAKADALSAHRLLADPPALSAVVVLECSGSRLSMRSLHALLRYSREDADEGSFEVSIFAEMFKQLLQQRYGHALQRALHAISFENSSRPRTHSSTSSKGNPSKRNVDASATDRERSHAAAAAAAASKQSAEQKERADEAAFKARFGAPRFVSGGVVDPSKTLETQQSAAAGEAAKAAAAAATAAAAKDATASGATPLEVPPSGATVNGGVGVKAAAEVVTEEVVKEKVMAIGTCPPVKEEAASLETGLDEEAGAQEAVAGQQEAASAAVVKEEATASATAAAEDASSISVEDIGCGAETGAGAAADPAADPAFAAASHTAVAESVQEAAAAPEAMDTAGAPVADKAGMSAPTADEVKALPAMADLAIAVEGEEQVADHAEEEAVAAGAAAASKLTAFVAESAGLDASGEEVHAIDGARPSKRARRWGSQNESNDLTLTVRAIFRFWDASCAGHLGADDMEEVLYATLPNATRRLVQALTDSALGRSSKLSYEDYSSVTVPPAAVPSTEEWQGAADTDT